MPFVWSKRLWERLPRQQSKRVQEANRLRCIITAVVRIRVGKVDICVQDFREESAVTHRVNIKKSMAAWILHLGFLHIQIFYI